MELAVPDVDGEHAGDAALEQAVREPARGGAQVDRVAAVQLDLEQRERVRELLAAARDEARRPLDLQVSPSGTCWPGLS